MPDCDHLYRQSDGRFTCVLCNHQITGDATQDLPAAIADELKRVDHKIGELRRAINWDPQYRYGYLSKEQAASYLNVSPRTLERWTADELIPHTRIGKCIRFHRADLDATMNDFKHGRRKETA